MNIFFDCKNGISSDMLLAAVNEIVNQGYCADAKIDERQEGGAKFPCADNKIIIKEPPYAHGRHLSHVLEIIEKTNADVKAKELAKKTYAIIAEAEAEVHEETLGSVHFHEVGRDQAIENIINFAVAITKINAENIYVTQINDGTGTVKCSHGEIPVPVPAVKALMKKTHLSESSDLAFGIREVDGERVTPSALAMIMAIEAKNIKEVPKEIKCIGEFFGGRDVEQKEGLAVYVE